MWLTMQVMDGGRRLSPEACKCEIVRGKDVSALSAEGNITLGVTCMHKAAVDKAGAGIQQRLAQQVTWFICKCDVCAPLRHYEYKH